ncbi:innexin inx2-like isoform X2 [Nasonia vitripennis]|nr:innexin inx2-like isoform X2 [Nasonia vitripennis]
MYLLDAFLEGQFRHYGPAVISSALTSTNAPKGGFTNPLLQQQVNPMARLFPKLAKCTLHTFGPGGSSQTHDALCVLPLNVVNEKIFVFLWFWLVFLAIAGALALFYRVTVLSQPWARRILLRASARGLSNATITSLQLNHFLGFGDWFVLRRLAADPLILRALADALAKAKTGDLDTAA